MNYNVFTDFHHAGLLNSLILLFEKRLGGKVYRPIGMEWAEKGFWKVYDHPATQAQFLGIGAATPDGSPKLNEVISWEGDTNPVIHWWNCKDIEGDFTNKAIDFRNFMKIPIDIVIASIPAHVEPFKRLCELHPNHPKLIFQIGNAWTVEAAMAPNVMASAIIHSVPDSIHFISYHQEFDLDVFKPYLNETINHPSKNIYSFVNCFNVQDSFRGDWLQFLDIETQMRDWTFNSFGGQCRDGTCDGTQALADKMREARFIWHTKAGGDGYGHVLHNTAAVGRPTIVKKEYYTGKMGEKLLIDEETCITIDNLSVNEIVNKITHFNQPDIYAKMCHRVYENFTEVCNFDKEFGDLKNFLETLLY